MTDKPTRLTLQLLKAPITNITPDGFTILLGAQYGSPTTIRIPFKTEMLDLRDGDLLTVFTECLMKPAQGNG
jgi:hypothetical protein